MGDPAIVHEWKRDRDAHRYRLVESNVPSDKLYRLGLHGTLAALCMLALATSASCRRGNPAAPAAKSAQQRPVHASAGSPARSKTTGDAREFKSPADAQEYRAIQAEMNLVGTLIAENNARTLDRQARIADWQASGHTPTKAELQVERAEMQSARSELLRLKARLLRVQARTARLNARVGGLR